MKKKEKKREKKKTNKSYKLEFKPFYILIYYYTHFFSLFSFMSSIDLKNKQYTTKELAKNIYALSLWDILQTQHLDEAFVVYFLLNENYQFLPEEEKITFADILQYQPHLQFNTLLHLYIFGGNLIMNYKNEAPSFDKVDH